MQGTIHMHSKLNGNIVSCSATALTNFGLTSRSYPTFVTWNDVFYPLNKAILQHVLNNSDTSDELTQSSWEQEHNSDVYSAQASHYADNNDVSDYHAIYNFSLCIKCIDRDTTSTWTKPKYLQCQFQIELNRRTGEGDSAYEDRFTTVFTKAYKDFIMSVWPKEDVTNYWTSHKCSEFFQITCLNCNISKYDEAIIDDDCYDAT